MELGDINKQNSAMGNDTVYKGIEYSFDHRGRIRAICLDKKY